MLLNEIAFYFTFKACYVQVHITLLTTMSDKMTRRVESPLLTFDISLHCQVFHPIHLLSFNNDSNISAIYNSVVIEWKSNKMYSNQEGNNFVCRWCRAICNVMIEYLGCKAAYSASCCQMKSVLKSLWDFLL